MQAGDSDAKRHSGSTVYVVDDDAALRSALRWLLDTIGLPVCTSASATEFLSTYRQGDPGCLLLNVHMPGMGGLDLLDELRRRELHIPVIMMTGCVLVADVVRAMRSGAFDFIEKPFVDQVLFAQVRAALRQDDEWRVRDLLGRGN